MFGLTFVLIEEEKNDERIYKTYLQSQRLLIKVSRLEIERTAQFKTYFQYVTHLTLSCGLCHNIENKQSVFYGWEPRVSRGYITNQATRSRSLFFGTISAVVGCGLMVLLSKFGLKFSFTNVLREELRTASTDVVRFWKLSQSWSSFQFRVTLKSSSQAVNRDKLVLKYRRDNICVFFKESSSFYDGSDPARNKATEGSTEAF